MPHRLLLQAVGTQGLTADEAKGVRYAARMRVARHRAEGNGSRSVVVTQALALASANAVTVAPGRVQQMRGELGD
jgi:hypothetical protein